MMEGPVMPTKSTEEKKKGWDSWEIEDALRTLVRAEEIEANAPLMKEVKKLAAKKAAEMKSVAGGVE